MPASAALAVLLMHFALVVLLRQFYCFVRRLLTKLYHSIVRAPKCRIVHWWACVGDDDPAIAAVSYNRPINPDGDCAWVPVSACDVSLYDGRRLHDAAVTHPSAVTCAAAAAAAAAVAANLTLLVESIFFMTAFNSWRLNAINCVICVAWGIWLVHQPLIR